MEENSDVNMKTDMSSTTGNVSETQQTSGTHGDVEMVIVVEKMEYDECTNEDLSQKEPGNNESIPVSPPKDIQLDKPHVSSKDGQIKDVINEAQKQKTVVSPNKDIIITNERQKAQSPEIIPSMGSIDAELDKVSEMNVLKNVVISKIDGSLNKNFHIVDVRPKTYSKKGITSSNKDVNQKMQTDKSGPSSKDITQVTQIDSTIFPNPNKDVDDQRMEVDKSHSPAKYTNQKMQTGQNVSPIKDVKQTMQTEKTISPIKNINQKIKIDKIVSSNNNISQKMPASSFASSTKDKNKTVSATKMQVDTSVSSVKDKTQKIQSEKSVSPSKDINQKIQKDKTVSVKDIKQKIHIQRIASPDKDDKQSLEATTKSPSKSLDLQKDKLESSENTVTTDENKEKLNETMIVDSPSLTPPIDSMKSCTAESTIETIVNTDSTSKIDTTKDNKKDGLVFNTTIDISEQSNDSQTNSDISEKEHNKSISRELKSLIKSAKESKIISECTQLTSKTRKSRTAVEGTYLNLNSSLEADKIQGVRRSSNNSQISNSSEKSEKAPKRSMRSQNPEFVNKVKQFLNSVTGKFQKNDSDDEETDENRKEHSENLSPSPKKKKPMEVPQPEGSPGLNKLRSDSYCWRCHWAVEQSINDKGHPPMQCTVCPRTFHFKCLSGNERNKIIIEKSWVCPECLAVLHAESSETRSPAMKKISLGLLCELLQYALERMMDLNGVEPFINPVDRAAFPDYDKYVVHPMDLTLMKNNITEGLYGSTEAFLADAQWILHNSIIFNTLQSKLTAGARALVRSCRAEMGEIEACPECYAAAHARKPTWFTDVCTTPHMLLWAKLKGFPYWPAKGMSVNSSGLVDVRFFGAHDRAWVPARDCFLYCEKDPNNFRTKRQDILDSMQEAEHHIRNISRKYGKFVYPPFKTQFDPTKLTEQLKMMIPTFEGELTSPIKEKSTSSPSAAKEKSRSNSKSSKSSLNDGDISETEEATPSRKMADGAEIAREEEDFCIDKDKSMEIDVFSISKEKDPSRKRRRSDLEEAVITIIETSNSEKRKKVETEDIRKDTVPVKEDKTKNNEEKVSKSVEESQTIDLINDKDENFSNKNEPSTSKTNAKELPTITVEKESTAVKTPNKIKIKPTRSSTPKDKDEKSTTPKRHVRSDKLTQVEKEKQETRSQKRRNSKNKSLNNSQTGKLEKSEKKSDKDTKDKNKETGSAKGKDIGADKFSEKLNKTNSTESQKFATDQVQFDDDTPIAVVTQNIVNKSCLGLPTISSVRSLSSTQNSETNKATNSNASEIMIANPNSSIFTPTSTDNVRNMKEAVNKLQKLRNEADPPVGRVGVRSFARMTTTPEKQTKPDDVEVEIKSEPMDFDDSDRQSEKLDLLNSFHLRPVNPSNLRGVRINKVVVAPISRKSTTAKGPEIRVKAKKTFPQPKKADEGRSELNSKNSMVYIPIQPPSTQAPNTRPTRPIAINGTANTQAVRPQAPTITSNANSIVNTLTTPLIPVPMVTSISNPIPTPTVMSNTNQTICVPTVGQVPTNVHTVPLITSVNGQWTFSLQPVMSGTSSPPVVNGLPDRSGNIPATLLPMTAGSALATAPVVQPSPTVNPPVISTPSTQPTQTISSSKDNPGEPPRLQQRPPLLNPLDSNTPIGCVPPPSTAGPLTAKLNQNAVKLADFFRNLLEDSLEKIDEPASQATALKLQLEQLQWKHQQEIKELKHNHDLTVTEMRASFEKEKSRAINEARRNAQVELEAAVKAAKSKQWCANCSQEAQFYCCWNTSYCDYSCQRTHWTQHFATCTQQRNQENNGNDNGNLLEKRLQPAPDNLPKNSQAPALTVGGKMAPTRVYSQDTQQPKASIIVSMVEDQSGNQTVKCVGTYKPGTQQLMSNEENAKKVVTSGGYLIVGAGSANQPLVTPSRRTHTIQYYT